MAIIRAFWDIVKMLLAAGAKPECQLLSEPDEGWLAHVCYEHSRGSLEQYSVFWDNHIYVVVTYLGR